MLVVLDDLHWADEATIAMLRYLVRDQALSDVVIAATAREVDLDPDIAGRLAELGRQADTARFDSGRSTTKSLERSSPTSWAPRWRGSW